MPGVLGLRFYLQRVVAGLAEIAEDQKFVAYSVRRHEGSATREAAYGVSRDISAGRWTSGIQIVAGDQDVPATRTRIANGEHNVPGHLPLYVCIELLDHTKMEVPGLREKGSAKCGGVGRRGFDRKPLGNSKITKARGGRPKYCRAVRCRKGAPAESRYSTLLRKAEAIGLSEERRILPKPLRAHAPR